MLNDIEIGTTENGKTFWLDAEARRRNLLLIGPPKAGKTKFLEDVVRQIIIEREGLFLLDPDGTLYDLIVEWCAQEGLHRSRSIHLIDLRDPEWSVGFDRFRTDTLPRTYQWEIQDAILIARIDAIVACFAQVFSGEDTHRTPLLRRCLRSACYALAVHGLTLAELTSLATNVGMRKALTKNLPNGEFRDIWTVFNAMDPQIFNDQFGSTLNRVIEIVGRPLVKRMLAQRRRVLDFRKAMDQGEIILYRAAPEDHRGFSREEARLLGTLLVGDLVVSALGRGEEMGLRKPFNVIIDEAPQYLNSDIEFALDRLRKRGVHFIFAIQRIGQPKDAGEGIYNALMHDCQTKMVFRQNYDPDAVELAYELFRPEFDLNQVKLTGPATVGHYIDILTSEGTTETEHEAYIKSQMESESEGRTEVWGQGAFEGQGTQAHWDAPYPIPYPLGLPEGIGQSDSKGRSHNTGGAVARQQQRGVGSAHAMGRGRAVQRGSHQILHPDIQWVPTQLKGEAEVSHEYIKKLRKLPDRYAVVKTMERDTVLIKTIEVEPALASPQRVREFVREVRERSAYTSPIVAVEQEVAERRQRLARLTKPKGAPSGLHVGSRGPVLKEDGWS